MPDNSPKLNFHSSFVRRFWFSFIWRFLATAIAFGLVIGVFLFALHAMGLPPKLIWWLEFAAQFLVLLLASYWAMGETMNKYLSELKKGI